MKRQRENDDDYLMGSALGLLALLIIFVWAML